MTRKKEEVAEEKKEYSMEGEYENADGSSSFQVQRISSFLFPSCTFLFLFNFQPVSLVSLSYLIKFIPVYSSFDLGSSLPRAYNQFF